MNEAWGKEYYNGEILKTWESLKILQDRVFVSSIPETTLIEVRIYDDQPDNAAITANAIAKAYFSYSLTNRSELQVQLVDTAYANKTPCYPKPARNYLIGILSGVFLGLVAATGISLVVFRKNKRLSMKPII